MTQYMPVESTLLICLLSDHYFRDLYVLKVWGRSVVKVCPIG